MGAVFRQSLCALAYGAIQSKLGTAAGLQQTAVRKTKSRRLTNGGEPMTTTRTFLLEVSAPTNAYYFTFV